MQPSLLFAAVLLVAGCASPDYGKDGLPARAHDKQLSNDTYAITAFVGAFKTQAMLKPLVIARARAIGNARGFKTFMFDAVDVDFDVRGSGYGAATVVKYSNAAVASGAGVVYGVDGGDRFETNVGSVDVVKLAKVTGSRDSGLRGNWYAPVWYDAVTGSSTSGGSHSGATGYLRPGRQRLLIHYWVFRSGVLGDPDTGFVPIEHDMQAGRTYVAIGRVKDNVLEIWLHDQALDKPATQSVVVPFRR